MASPGRRGYDRAMIHSPQSARLPPARLPPIRLPRVMLAALALFAMSGCDAPAVSIDGRDGVPLPQLDTAGETVHQITLLGPDTVRIVHGDRLAISVAGDAAVRDSLRFVLADGKLGIGRLPGLIPTHGTATITVTTPAIDQLVLAGSGTIGADRFDGADLAITVAGSGSVNAGAVRAGRLKVEVLGSGDVAGTGMAGTLALSIAGSGEAHLAGLRAQTVAIDIAGSGEGALASDGTVAGAITGSGEVTVRGRAQCTVQVTGSGRITCQP